MLSFSSVAVVQSLGRSVEQARRGEAGRGKASRVVALPLPSFSGVASSARVARQLCVCVCVSLTLYACVCVCVGCVSVSAAMALAPAVRRCDTNETKRTNVPNVDVAFVAFCIFSVGYGELCGA